MRKRRCESMVEMMKSDIKKGDKKLINSENMQLVKEYVFDKIENEESAKEDVFDHVKNILYKINPGATTILNFL